MDEHPFIELIEKHEAAITHVCRSFCREAEEREDLRQEILMHLWMGWKDYRPEHRPITWLYRVALNTAISWRRGRLRQVATVPLDGFDLPEDAALREQAAHMKALIAMLPAGDKRLIDLYLDGFSTDEIGRLLGISQSNVTTRIGRIKEKLRRMVSSEW
ncbi:MAG: sigma-70 family RNA polymerase sigma factor [Bacteroidales bacterium]|nr:sigma-70 family RNA polymerase sigma factor [Bacteroidales bacterium]